MTPSAPGFYEFFAGGGMARAGLGPGWRCLLANDLDPAKAASYRANWGAADLRVGDVADLAPSDLPPGADLAWASFPCQDLSLAGGCAGMDPAARTRSGTFWPFWALMEALHAEGRAPPLIVLENVPGVLTSRRGADFTAICAALSHARYRVGALVVDAALFVPQSRPRVFFVAVAEGCALPIGSTADAPARLWHPRALVNAWADLPPRVKRTWLWWTPPAPLPRARALADVIEDAPTGVKWHAEAETLRLLALMSPLNRAKVEAARASGGRAVGAVYRRTRPDDAGVRRQRAEVRFDGLAGCLRTPGGGSSRQTVLVVEGARVRSRLLSPREAARLMGLPDGYRLPARPNDAYRLAGDGLCVPAVAHLARHLLEPVLAARPAPALLAAE